MCLIKRYIPLVAMLILNESAFSQTEISLGNDAPDFKLKSLASNLYINFPKIKDTFLVIDFWATWCGPCVAGFPHLNQLVKEFKNEPIKFISVVYENESKILKFIKNHQLNTEIGIDTDLSMWHSYMAWAIPHSVIIDKTGKVAGFDNLNETDIKDLIEGKKQFLGKIGSKPSFYGSASEEFEFYKKKQIDTTK